MLRSIFVGLSSAEELAFSNHVISFSLLSESKFVNYEFPEPIGFSVMGWSNFAEILAGLTAYHTKFPFEGAGLSGNLIELPVSQDQADLPNNRNVLTFAVDSTRPDYKKMKDRLIDMSAMVETGVKVAYHETENVFTIGLMWKRVDMEESLITPTMDSSSSVIQAIVKEMESQIIQSLNQLVVNSGALALRTRLLTADGALNELRDTNAAQYEDFTAQLRESADSRDDLKKELALLTQRLQEIDNPQVVVVRVNSKQWTSDPDVEPIDYVDAIE